MYNGKFKCPTKKDAFFSKLEILKVELNKLFEETPVLISQLAWLWLRGIYEHSGKHMFNSSQLCLSTCKGTTCFRYRCQDVHMPLG